MPEGMVARIYAKHYVRYRLTMVSRKMKMIWKPYMDPQLPTFKERLASMNDDMLCQLSSWLSLDELVVLKTVSKEMGLQWRKIALMRMYNRIRRPLQVHGRCDV